MIRLVRLPVLLLALLPLLALAAAIDGAYEGRYTSADGRGHRITFILKADGGTLTGIVHGTVNKTTVSEGTIQGDQVSFWAQWPYGRYHYQGKLAGGELQLTVQAGEHRTQMTAKRLSD